MKNIFNSIFNRAIALANDSEGHGGFLVKKNGEDHLPTTKGGKFDPHLAGAAWAALHEGYRGNKYEGPDKEAAIAKLKRLYKEHGMPLPNEADAYIYATHRDDHWEFALPNDAGIDDDGWALIAPYGRHAKTRLYRDGNQIKEQKFIQVLDNESADTMMASENSFFRSLKRAIVGIPVYRLHGDLNDHDPKAIGNAREKIKIGVVDKIRKGERGIEGHFALDNDGADAVADGCKFPSAFWWVLPNGKEGDSIVAKPFKLISVALTPYPNISGVESLANARTAVESQLQQTTNNNDMKKIAGYLLAMGATSLANNAEPNEDQVLAAVQTILDGRQQTMTALGNEKTTLNTTIQTLTTERDGHKTRADQNATSLANEQTARKADRKVSASGIVDAAIKLGIVTVADRDAKITALENSADFAKDSEALLKTAPSHKTNLNGLDMSGRQTAALSNEAQALQNEYNAAFETELTATGQDATKAHQNIMHLPKYAGLAAKLVPKQGGNK